MEANPQRYWPVLADALLQSGGQADDRARRLARDVALVVGACLLTALLAQVKIPLGFTPVPITGQTFAVLLAGAALGRRRGAAAMLLYLAAGSVLPFYAGGASGLVWAMPSGGYIIGFIPAAWLVGWLAERGWDRQPKVILAMLAGNAAIYIPGLFQLSRFAPGIDPSAADGQVWAATLGLGLYPFIPGDLVKLAAASLLLPGAWQLVNLVKGGSR